jgi:hypothetical protein
MCNQEFDLSGDDAAAIQQANIFCEQDPACGGQGG